MKRRLYITALVTLPIIAAYGALPFYLFSLLSSKDVAKICGGISVNIIILWVSHIYFVGRYSNKKPVIQFFATYTVSALIQGCIAFIGKIAGAPRPPVERYFLYILMTTIAVNAIVMIITNSIVASYRRMIAEREVQELKIEAGEAQRQVLIQQLRPHFLFNALSVLKSLIAENAEAAQDYSIKLSEFLRYSIQAHKREVVSLTEELKFTEDYLELQGLRFAGAFCYTIHIPQAAMALFLPAFALQTLVENCFKHNYFTEKSPLKISITHLEGRLTIRNNLEPIKAKNASSTGLNNLAKRYKLIAGEHIDVRQDAHEFCVTIPLLQQ